MINFDDVLRVYPEAKHFTAEQAEPFLEAANIGFPDSRFKAAAQADRGRAHYVMHMLSKAKLDPNAPHIRAQMGSPKARIKKPHVWDGTKYGEALRKAVKA